jgi:[CysO sulfur-carrier protein]-S-L-cysteine hydrolase
MVSPGNVERLLVSPDLWEAESADAGVLVLPRAVLAAMLDHVTAGYPDEACGVLAGDSSGGVARHFPAANASATPRTFSEIGAQELLAIWNELEVYDWDMLAYYHSHPATPAYPSPRDVLWSRNWPGTLYVIFSLAELAAPVLRAFRIVGEAISECRILVES